MIALHIRLHVGGGHGRELEKAYSQVFLPALRVQRGFRGSSLFRTYGADLAAEINAARDVANYVVELRFDTEESRRAWVASEEHATAWPSIRGLASEASHVGSDVLVTEVFEQAESTSAGLGGAP